MQPAGHRCPAGGFPTKPSSRYIPTAMAWRPKITVRNAAATAIRKQKPVDGHLSTRPTCLTTVKITAASLLRSQVTEERSGPPLSSTRAARALKLESNFAKSDSKRFSYVFGGMGSHCRQASEQAISFSIHTSFRTAQ